MNHPLNKFPHPWFILCVKKHCCQQSAFSATDAPLKVRKFAEPPSHLRSKISSRALATFQNIEKARKQEAISIKCVVCSYFHKILHYSKNSQNYNSFRTLLTQSENIHAH